MSWPSHRLAKFSGDIDILELKSSKAIALSQRARVADRWAYCLSIYLTAMISFASPHGFGICVPGPVIGCHTPNCGTSTTAEFVCIALAGRRLAADLPCVYSLSQMPCNQAQQGGVRPHSPACYFRDIMWCGRRRSRRKPAVFDLVAVLPCRKSVP